MIYALGVTGDPSWWRAMLGRRIGKLLDGTRFLDEGWGTVRGDTAEYVRELCAAIEIVNRAPAGAISAEQRDELAELWSLLRDWARYDAAGRPGEDFPQWCREQGSDHWVANEAGPIRVYYQP